jgi:hypothetical protein
VAVADKTHLNYMTLLWQKILHAKVHNEHKYMRVAANFMLEFLPFFLPFSLYYNVLNI